VYAIPCEISVYVSIYNAVAGYIGLNIIIGYKWKRDMKSWERKNIISRVHFLVYIIIIS